MYRVMNESFIGIKEAIIYGAQKKYYDEFYKTGKRFSNVSGKVQFLANAPKYGLEFIAFSIILFFILSLIYFGKENFDETLPVLAIYIFAGYKLLPIFQSIYLGVVQIKNNLPAYDKIEKELFESKKYSIDKKKVEGKKIELKNDESVDFNNVSFSYNNDGKKVLEKINIKIKKNSLNFIVGTSGSGKSTVLDLLLGLIFANDGSVNLGQEILKKNNSKIWQQNIGYVVQNIFLLDDTIQNNICLFSDENNKIDKDIK